MCFFSNRRDYTTTIYPYVSSSSTVHRGTFTDNNQKYSLFLWTDVFLGSCTLTLRPTNCLVDLVLRPIS